jgi:hypothetical protein
MLEPLPIVRNISNRERGGPLKRTPSLGETSPIATCLKIRTRVHVIMPLTPFVVTLALGSRPKQGLARARAKKEA